MSEHMPNEHIAADPHQHATGDAHHASGAVSASVFSEADRTAFRAEDFAAGKAVVVLILSIFSGGVVLYSVVAYFVAF